LTLSTFVFVLDQTLCTLIWPFRIELDELDEDEPYEPDIPDESEELDASAELEALAELDALAEASVDASA
jgi:hypothetical protein